MRLNFLESIAKYYNLGSLKVTHDTVAPSNPSNGDLWWEPGARYAQPWEWDSSNSQWMSQLIPFNYGSLRYTGTRFVPAAVWFYNTTANRIKVVSANLFVQTFATAQTQGVNFYNFTLRYLLGTGSYTTLYTFPEDTGNNSTAMAANSYRRINANIDLYLPGNAWNLAFVPVAYAAAGEIEVSAIVYLRIARP